MLWSVAIGAILERISVGMLLQRFSRSNSSFINLTACKNPFSGAAGYLNDTGFVCKTFAWKKIDVYSGKLMRQKNISGKCSRFIKILEMSDSSNEPGRVRLEIDFTPVVCRRTSPLKELGYDTQGCITQCAAKSGGAGEPRCASPGSSEHLSYCVSTTCV